MDSMENNADRRCRSVSSEIHTWQPRSSTEWNLPKLIPEFGDLNLGDNHAESSASGSLRAATRDRNIWMHNLHQPPTQRSLYASVAASIYHHVNSQHVIRPVTVADYLLQNRFTLNSQINPFNVNAPRTTPRAVAPQFPENQQIPQVHDSNNDYLLLKLRQLVSNPAHLCEYASTYEGSRTLKRHIEKRGTSPFVSSLIKALAAGLPDLAFTVPGRSLILRCLQHRIHDSTVLCSKMATHFLELARDESGCLLLNMSMPYMNRTYKDIICNLVVHNAVFLAQDLYGTHVVQEVLAMEDLCYSRAIVEQVRRIIATLSKTPSGSYLLEKCLYSRATTRMVAEELMNLSGDQLRRMASDKYGNFVVRAALVKMEEWGLEEEERVLLKGLEVHMDYLRSHPYGMHVYHHCKARGKAHQTRTDIRVQSWFDC